MLTRSNLFFLLIYFSKYPKSDGHGKETADIGVRETADTGARLDVNIGKTGDSNIRKTAESSVRYLYDFFLHLAMTSSVY